jgi:hypothetical protein
LRDFFFGGFMINLYHYTCHVEVDTKPKPTTSGDIPVRQERHEAQTKKLFLSIFIFSAASKH